MNISVIVRDSRVADVQVTGTALRVTLRDGRIISAPLYWFPRLQDFSRAEDRAIWVAFSRRIWNPLAYDR